MDAYDQRHLRLLVHIKVAECALERARVKGSPNVVGTESRAYDASTMVHRYEGAGFRARASLRGERVAFYRADPKTPTPRRSRWKVE